MIPVLLPRALPMVEAMVAWYCVNHLLRHAWFIASCFKPCAKSRRGVFLKRQNYLSWRAGLNRSEPGGVGTLVIR